MEKCEKASSETQTEIGEVTQALEAVFGTRVLPGTIYIYLRVFFFLLFSNFMGLIPYIFTRTRHLVITLALSLPL